MLATTKARAIAASGLLLLFVGALGVLGYPSAHLEWQSFHPQRVSPPIPDIQGAREVSFDSASGKLRGFYVDTRNGAAIVLGHGTFADRNQMAGRARILASHGYGALAFDWPGHGTSDGKIAWDEGEREGLERAVEFAAAQPGVHLDRIGLLGFSEGAYLALQVAARERRVAAIVAEGAFTDVESLLRWQYRSRGWLGYYPALWVNQWYGVEPRREQPIDVVDRIAPRPLLLIAGIADNIVPAHMAQDLQEKAGASAQVWVVDGASHGDYERVTPAEYERRLVEFFNRSLLPNP